VTGCHPFLISCSVFRPLNVLDVSWSCQKHFADLSLLSFLCLKQFFSMHLESSLRWKTALPLQLSSLSCRIEQVAILTAWGEQKNRENRIKNNWKNQTVKKNRLKFWKNRPVRFYKHETEKTRKNQSQTGKNQAKPKKPSQIGLNWFLF